jgi:hypothetical protein
VEGEAPGFREVTQRAIGWEWAFLVLAVRRGHLLLLNAGAPETIARSPNLVTDCAITFLVALRDLPPEASAQSRDTALHGLLRETFTALTAQLGAQVVGELRAWQTRNYVDKDEKMRLWMWSVLLPRLAGAYGTRATQTAPLPVATMQRFRGIVGNYFSPELRRIDNDLATRARLQPLSDLEQVLVRVEGPSIQELRRTPSERQERLRNGSASRDVDAVDVVDLLGATGRRERTRKAWHELEGELTPRETALVVVWARQEGILRKMPVHLISSRLTDNSDSQQ